MGATFPDGMSAARVDVRRASTLKPATAAGPLPQPAVPSPPRARPWIKYDQDSAWFDCEPGVRMTLRAPGQGSGTAVTLCESRIAPGARCALHLHHAADETLFVLSGSLTVRCGGELVEAAEGTTVVIPRGTPHLWWNTSAHEARVLAYFTPGGIEDYFVTLARQDPAAHALAARQHDCHLIAGPAWP
ncbi:cupin domain-containing protein [Pseudoxanthomonas putridarboris]|uniref:Cupin domain-containing protein n=1 Tax=Pseudoxanthomonas putridarboris TaxID=752605 RepID=A0ABU9J390_9GAMM